MASLFLEERVWEVWLEIRRFSQDRSAQCFQVEITCKEWKLGALVHVRQG